MSTQCIETHRPASSCCKARSTCSSSARCLAGPTHGHAIAKHIQRTSEDLLQVETGSLYPALHRLEAKGWIAASWELSDKGKRARYLSAHARWGGNSSPPNNPSGRRSRAPWD